MERVGNILDPIQTNLTPYLWTGNPALPTLRPQVSRWLKETIYDELEKYHPHPEQWASLVLTGSLTTWQFSEASDCDVSVFVNANFMPEWDRAKLIGMVIHSIDGKTVMGTPYPLQCFIVSPKITKELLYQPGLRSGYDIDTDQWLVPPEPARSHDVEKEYNAWYVYALETIDKLKSLIKYNPTRATEYWKYLHRRRREEESSGRGDYSIFNIIFKLITAKGLVGDLDKLTGEHTASKEAALPSHRLEWNPGQEGKGLVLTDGSIWTWPTQNMRPEHWKKDAIVKSMGKRQIPGTAFHIHPEGSVYQVGEGRSLNSDHRAMIQNADPNLDANSSLLPPASVQYNPYGHAENVIWNTQPQTLGSVYDWEEDNAMDPVRPI